MLPFAASAFTESIDAVGDACSAVYVNGTGLISAALGAATGVTDRVTPSILILFLLFYIFNDIFYNIL
jgi:hypothetical protein